MRTLKSKTNIRFIGQAVATLLMANIFCFALSACQYLHPTTEGKGIIVYGDTAPGISNTIYILTPHLYRYDTPSGFRKIQEFDHETFFLFHNDTLVVLYEIVPWQNNIIHVFNLKSGAHFKKKYKRKCTADGGIEQNFHTRLENGELVTYWGCENDGYRLGLQTLQLEEVNLEAAGITGENLWKYPLSEELRKAYHSADTSSSALNFSIDSTKFRVHKKYHRLWHLKDSLDNDYLTDGKVTVKLDVATTKSEDWN